MLKTEVSDLKTKITVLEVEKAQFQSNEDKLFDKIEEIEDKHSKEMEVMKNEKNDEIDELKKAHHT